MSSRWRVGALILGMAAMLLALLGWAMARPSSGTGAPGVNSQGSIARMEPRPAPDIQLELFGRAGSPWRAGAPWRLSEQPGKTVVVNFWASWCPPCRSEAGALAQAARDYEKRGVIIAGVNVWDNDVAAQEFLEEFNVEYPSGRDASKSASVDYGVTGLPETFVVDPQGRIVARWVGPVSKEALAEMIDLAAAKQE